MGTCHYAPDGWCDDPKCIEGCKKRRKVSSPVPTRMNFDGTPHVCSFNADGHCTTHPFSQEAPVSSNLVTRLRAKAAKGGVIPIHDVTLEEAANELERLQGESEHRLALYEKRQAELSAVMVGRDRLRASLDAVRAKLAEYLERLLQGRTLPNRWVGEINDIVGAAISGDASAPETGAHPDPAKRCQHDLLKPASTIQVLAADHVRCAVCLEEWRLPTKTRDCVHTTHVDWCPSCREDLKRLRSAEETSAPPDGTVDGDGVWRGGKWHPNPYREQVNALALECAQASAVVRSPACPKCEAVRKLGLTACFEHKQSENGTKDPL